MPLWLLFGEANLAAHLILVIVSIVAMLGQMAFGATAFGRRFRRYSLVTLATVVVSYGLALAYAPAVAAGDPTPYIGLYERVGFSAYFLWALMLCAALWRRPADQDVPSSDAPPPALASPRNRTVIPQRPLPTFTRQKDDMCTAPSG
jgi:hypothetical protein